MPSVYARTNEEDKHNALTRKFTIQKALHLPVQLTIHVRRSFCPSS
jgi:hypothetical protein